MGCCESSEERDRLTAYEWLPPAMEAPPTLPSQTQTDEKLPNVRRRPLRSKTDSQSEPILPEMPRHEWLPPHFSQFYDLGAVMGVGTTSKVYRVYHRISKLNHNSEHALACKVINKRRITTSLKKNDIEPLLGQLRKEVDILRRINHCNIVSFVDFMETRSKLFIITERLDGGELFDHLLNHGPLREGVACQVLYGVFSAVAYLHERGVVHRDIKAENLIFFKDPRGEVSLKLIDFGLSTILGHDLTGSFMGTGGYIAPEIRQNKNYSTSVDSWSLGVLLYCTLSAKLPFAVSIESLPSSTVECRRAFTLSFPEDAWGGISDSCKDLITSLLEINPVQRATAHQAIQHPWFQHERERRRQFDSSSSSANRKELRVLHSQLRPSRSTFQLERRWNPLHVAEHSKPSTPSSASSSSSSRKGGSEDDMFSCGLPLSVEDTPYLSALAEQLTADRDSKDSKDSKDSNTHRNSKDIQFTDRQLLEPRIKPRKRCSSYNEMHARNIEQLYRDVSAGDTSEEEACSDEGKTLKKRNSKVKLDPTQGVGKSVFAQRQAYDPYAGDVFYTSYRAAPMPLTGSGGRLSEVN
ncbi:kinase-like domain-containing protein [Ochromonadaceae sp. CCMP2298]|nr:kinase-like domain-containing protein [Ochromonadaceae sp. CCMP2298]